MDIMRPNGVQKQTERERPSIQQIRQAIGRSGYLFEQQVAYRLREYGYLVAPNFGFEDVDSGESREIDLHAVIGRYEEDLDIWIEQLLLIECKKTTNPLVFFSKPTYRELRHIDNYFELVGNPESVDAGRSRGILSLEHYLDFSDLSHRYKLSDTSSQFCMVMPKGKEWEAKHEHIYDGMIVPLIKCLSSEKKDFREGLPESMIKLRILYPIVLVDSELYLMNSDTNEINRKKWILFHRQYESKTVKITAMIDFVRYKHIEAYLERVRKSFDAICERVLKQREDLFRKMKNKKTFIGD
jgi:hypothetical protein